MARSKHARTLRHFLALNLIASMQVGGKMPNLDWILKDGNDSEGRMIPEPDLPLSDALNLMRDLMTLVDAEVYDEFRVAAVSAATIDGVMVTDGTVRSAMRTTMAHFHLVTDTMEVSFWEEPPHPCSFITREIVADLLL